MEDGGLLGDLPRTRPGTRSSRRGPRQAPPVPPQPSAARASGVTAGEAATEPLKLAVGAAEVGLRIASRITAEAIRRLPRL